LFVDPQWIYVDLGATYSVNRVELNWETAYARSYRIHVSSDAESWTDVYWTTTGDGGVDDVSFAGRSARYVRVYGTTRGSQWGYSLWDFEVYGDASTTPDLALGKGATASSVQQAGWEASKAVDGNSSTRWSAQMFVDPQWIYVDLGST
jgi:hypothetical protein